MDKQRAVFVGIDVSKDRLDVHLRPSGEAFCVLRDDRGLADLVSRLQRLPVVLVVLEATGGFEATVAAAPAGIGLPLCIVNPRQIRDYYAKAMGRLPKADTLSSPSASSQKRDLFRSPRETILSNSSAGAGSSLR